MSQLPDLVNIVNLQERGCAPEVTQVFDHRGCWNTRRPRCLCQMGHSRPSVRPFPRPRVDPRTIHCFVCLRARPSAGHGLPLSLVVPLPPALSSCPTQSNLHQKARQSPPAFLTQSERVRHLARHVARWASAQGSSGGARGAQSPLLPGLAPPPCSQTSEELLSFRSLASTVQGSDWDFWCLPSCSLKVNFQNQELQMSKQL